MKKMFGKKLAFLLAAAVLAAGAFTSCEIDLGGDDGGSSSGSKLPNGTIKAVYYNSGINVVVFYDDGKFVRAYTEDEYSYHNDSITDIEFEIGNQGTYIGDPTKDTGDDNKVLLTFTKLKEYVNGEYKYVTPEEYVKDERNGYSLEDFTDLEATITGDGAYFDCTEGFAYISDYIRNKDY